MPKYENAFREYVKNTPSRMGNEVDQNQINQMTKDLNYRIVEELPDLKSDSILDIDDIGFLEKLKERLSADGDLNAFNLKYGNGRPSRALYQYINFLKTNSRNTKSEYNQSAQNTDFYPKNIILYGPPGTGKTYSHKKLISIIENGHDLSELANQEYDSKIFQTVKDENRYEFVTFHQSFSYEDFVEGFRPQENGGLIIEDGILKEISKRAKNNLEAYTYSEIKKEFETIFKELILDKLENEERVTIKMKKSNFYITEVTEKSIIFDKESGDSKHPLSINTLKKMYETGQNDIVIGGLQHYYTPLLNFLLESSKEVKKEPLKNFYLIIDEINRGNISKILGELITLIEDDKRIGEENELTLKLPYSRERFGIPKNLYIIGTMNTADKSIALIDVALRRRFSFIEMNPIDEFLPQNIIEINKIIESKLSKDYKIGHGYFMGNSDLKSVIEYKIKPLIEEYFYNDSAAKDKIFKLLDDGGVENA